MKAAALASGARQAAPAAAGLGSASGHKWALGSSREACRRDERIALGPGGPGCLLALACGCALGCWLVRRAWADRAGRRDPLHGARTLPVSRKRRLAARPGAQSGAQPSDARSSQGETDPGEATSDDDDGDALDDASDGGSGARSEGVKGAGVGVGGVPSLGRDWLEVRLVDVAQAEGEIPIKFLQGCFGDTAEAARRWGLTKQWRASARIDTMLTDTSVPCFDTIKEYYPHFWTGRARNGCCIYVEKTGEIQVKKLIEAGVTVPNLVRYYLYDLLYCF